MIVLLYDGRCGLCQRSMRTLNALDWFRKLQFENLHDPMVREKYAAGISFTELNQEMHVLFPDKTILKGFFAFRRICWHLPLLWILAPFLYIPGISWVGNCVYRWVAGHRGR